MFLKQAAKAWNVVRSEFSSFDALYCICAILVFIPLYLQWDLHLDGTVLEESIATKGATIAFASAIGITFPLMFDLSLDIFSSTGSEHYFSRVAILVGSVVPPFMLLLPSKYSICTVYAVTTSFQRLMCKGGAIGIFIRCDPEKHWIKVAMCYSAIATFFLIEILDFYGMYSQCHATRVIAVILRYVFNQFPIIEFVRFMYAMSKKYPDYFSKGDILGLVDAFNHNEYVVFSMCVIFFVALIGIMCFPALTDPAMWFIEVTNPTYFILLYIWINLTFVMIAIAPTRSSRLNLFKIEYELEQKRTFIKHISHEIRTPLNIVSVGLDIVERELQPIAAAAQSMELVRDIKSSTVIAIEILNDLINYEKLVSNLVTLERSVVRPLEFLQCAIRPFLVQAQAKRITLHFHPQRTLESWSIDVDMVKLSQVLRNFVSNALKFTPEGGEVTVSASIVSRKFLKVEVKDTGVGIAPENIGKVFNNIVQFDANKNQGGGGSGLGLWLSSRVVQLHGGSVGLASDFGAGSTFFFQVPAKYTRGSLSLLSGELFSYDMGNVSKKLSQIVPTDPQADLMSLLSGISSQSFRVLLVDDSHMNRRIIERLLESFGHVCEEAADGLEAVKKYESSTADDVPFDAIFMDNFMPNMSGPEATAAIRARGYTGGIIGLTGNAAPDDIADFKDHGADLVLIKPVNANDLENSLRDLISKKKKLNRSMTQHTC